MAKSDFTFVLAVHKGYNYLAITDLDLGNMSVTNNIEFIVNDICNLNHIYADDYIIVYRDSDKLWDGWSSSCKTFVALRVPNQLQAVNKYIRIYLNRNQES